MVDSSSLIALERAGMAVYLNKTGYDIIIPPAVKEEIQKGKSTMLLKKAKVQELSGRTLKKARELEFLNISKGEAQCCALAAKLKTGFIVCDDQKFIRQRFFSDDRRLKEIKVLGFAFFLHQFYKKKLINDVWSRFNKIIELNNWKRSEVQAANYTFLKKLGH